MKVKENGDPGQTVDLTRLRARVHKLEKVEEKNRKIKHSLQERVKELNCLYGLSSLVDSNGHSLEQIAEGLVNLIPPAWQYPSSTCARLILEGVEYKTANFIDTEWKQEADIRIAGQKAGKIEVCYLVELPSQYEGPFLSEERSLLNVISERLGKIAERIRTEDAVIKQAHQLGERVKELSCLYGLSGLAARRGISLEELFREFVRLIPLSWQYPGQTCARIIIQGKEFKTDNFSETEWVQSTVINTYGKETGAVEVFYLESIPESDEGPFLKEERSLIEAIAEHLSVINEKYLDAEALKNSEQELKERQEALEKKNVVLRELLVQIEVEKQKKEADVTANINSLVLPIIGKIKLEYGENDYFNLLESTLSEIAAPFGNRLAGDRTKLTPRELEICNMIRNGMTSKEIARLLNISLQTIEWHRKCIRKKTGLTNNNTNLTSYLIEL